MQVFIPAIPASENQRGDALHRNFAEFGKFLLEIGCADCSLLNPKGYWDITFWDHCVYGPPDDDEPIHKILFPRIAFRYGDYLRLCGIAPDGGSVDKKWRRAKCDVLAMWCHIHYGNDIFVTSDANFHKATKKPRLAALGAKEILRPAEVVQRLATS